MSPLLTVQGLRAGFGTNDILRGASLSVAAGEVVIISGRNGCGKSTLLRAIFGLLPLRAGQIDLGGTSIQGMPPASWHSAGAAFAPQGQRVFRDLTLHEHFALIAPDRSVDRLLQDRSSITAQLLGDLGEQTNRKAGTLSGGQRQRLCLALVFAMNPRLVLLDEPTLGLDDDTAALFWSLIEQKVLSHSLSVLAVEHRAVAMRQVQPRCIWMEDGLLASVADFEKAHATFP